MKFNAIGLVVADLGRAVEFYGGLGLEFGDPDSEHGHAEADLGGGLRLMLDTIDGILQFDPGYSPASGGPAAGLAFQCGSPAAVDQAFAELVARGARAHKQPWDAFWGQRYAQLRDPDGNGVDLYSPL